MSWSRDAALSTPNDNPPTVAEIASHPHIERHHSPRANTPDSSARVVIPAAELQAKSAQIPPDYPPFPNATRYNVPSKDRAFSWHPTTSTTPVKSRY